MVISWHQDGIFFARMGLVQEAADYNTRKLDDSPRRFPTFWGPGHDWAPDHNWGGSGMIGLQEMLMQTIGGASCCCPPGRKTGTVISNCTRRNKPCWKARSARARSWISWSRPSHGAPMSKLTGAPACSRLDLSSSRADGSCA